MINRLKNTYNEFPKNFWVLIGSFFIDRVGGALIFPFLALYITSHFQVGMTQVGVIFALFAVSSLGGNLLGGNLTDRFGRKKIAIFGLLISGFSSLLLGIINDINLLYATVLLVGFFSSLGEPAQSAMVADLLPAEQRNEGYGILRVVANLAVTIGPAIGGILAARSFMTLFILDAVLSAITALIVFIWLPETHPQLINLEKSEKIIEKPLEGGYAEILRDGLFILIVVFSTFSAIVYMQMNSTLPVFLRDEHAVSTIRFGYLLSMNAAIVVLFQFWVSRRIKRFPTMKLLAVGTLFYMVGFGMYGFTNIYIWFIIAMIIITIGEMIVSPTSQALVAQLAPEDKRGRYMAFSGMAWVISTMLGPLAAGIIIDNYNPNWVWYAGIILTFIAAAGFGLLHSPIQRRLKLLEVPVKNDTAMD